MVRNAPPTAIKALPVMTAQVRMANTESPWDSTAIGFSPVIESANPAGVFLRKYATTMTVRSARMVIGDWVKTTFPRSGISLKNGISSG